MYRSYIRCPSLSSCPLCAFASPRSTVVQKHGAGQTEPESASDAGAHEATQERMKPASMEQWIASHHKERPQSCPSLRMRQEASVACLSIFESGIITGRQQQELGRAAAGEGSIDEISAPLARFGSHRPQPQPHVSARRRQWAATRRCPFECPLELPPQPVPDSPQLPTSLPRAACGQAGVRRQA